MKQLAVTCWLTITQVVIAQEIAFQIEAGNVERSQALTAFQAPATWAGHYTVSADGGRVSGILQVDAEGRAVLQTEGLKQGESLNLRAMAMASGAPSLEWKQDGDVLLAIRRVGETSQPLFSYQMAAGPVPQGVAAVYRHGAHLHPVYTPAGRLLTDNHPADHLWHRGIWMSWTKTEFEGGAPDFWNMGKPLVKGAEEGPLTAEIRFDALLRTWTGPVQAGFISQHRFIDRTSGQEKDVLVETWEVTVNSFGGRDALHIIDLTSTQRCAGSSPLKLPEYHYGGLGVRGNRLWAAPDDVKMLTSEGRDRKTGDATRGRWVSLGGEVDGGAAVMVILIHPENFRFPQPLRLNPKNPQLSVAPSQLGDWSIEPGTDYVSRYRFILADKAAAADWIEPLWNDYAQPVKVMVK